MSSCEKARLSSSLIQCFRFPARAQEHDVGRAGRVSSFLFWRGRARGEGRGRSRIGVAASSSSRAGQIPHGTMSLTLFTCEAAINTHRWFTTTERVDDYIRRVDRLPPVISDSPPLSRAYRPSLSCIRRSRLFPPTQSTPLSLSRPRPCSNSTQSVIHPPLSIQFPAQETHPSSTVRGHHTSRRICLPWGLRCPRAFSCFPPRPRSLTLAISLACSPSSSERR